MASSPVGLRPPWVKISQRSGSAGCDTFLASIATTMHWSPNFSAASFTKSRRSTAAVLIETLSAPDGSSARMSSMVRTPPPTVSGMKQASAVRRTTSSMMPRFSWLAVMSRKRQFVGAGLVIGDRRRDRIAGIAQIDEIDALDDAAVFDVEAGNDADLEHRQPRPRRADQRKRPAGIEPPVIERAAGDGAGEVLGARLEQRAHVVERRKSARGDHRNAKPIPRARWWRRG